MAHKHSARYSVAAALTLAAGAARATLVSGSVSWTDSAGGTHPSRDTQVFIVEENGFFPTPHIALVSLDLSGHFSLDFVFRPGATGYAIRPIARNSAVFVSPDGTEASTYMDFTTFHFGTTPPAGGHDIVTAPGAPMNSALSIADGMLTTWWFGRAARADASPIAPPRVSATFPTASPSGTAWTGATLDIVAGDEDDWDVVGHEYAHYLGDLAPDHLQGPVGGAHSAGVSSIPTRGKATGIRLGWQEGYASWAGCAAQSFDTVAQHLPAGVPNVGDGRYTDTVDLDLFHDLESELGDNVTRAHSDGEGDENSVNRILWDLGDPANEPHDRVSMGHSALMNRLRHITVDLPAPGGGTRGVETLSELWRNLSGQDGHTTVTYAEVVDYGAIFQEYNVSPVPTSGDMGVLITAPPPTFDWARGNDLQNDDFRVIILDAALSDIVMSIGVGDVTAYTLTAAQWAVFTAAPAEYRYVIAGSDTVSGFPVEEVTGLYWSDAYDFSVMVPSPGMVVLGALGVVFLRRRRR